MIHAALIALLLFLAVSLIAAMVGAALRPEPMQDAGGFQVATRSANENLQNCNSPGGAPSTSGDRGTAPGRMYARLPDPLPRFFRRAL